MSDVDTIKTFHKNQFPVNPPFPENFDDTPNDERPKWEIEFLWGRPYIEIIEFSGDPKFRKQWFDSWPDGKRFDVRCLDGGAWDRPTAWGMFKTLDEALRCCESGPVWRQAI